MFFSFSESVAELIKRFPDAILVREPLRAFVSKSDDVDTIEEHSRLVQVGETLLLVGEVITNKSRANSNANTNNSNQNQSPSTQKPQTRFLRCFDKNGENVYLPCDLKGKLRAINFQKWIRMLRTISFSFILSMNKGLELFELGINASKLFLLFRWYIKNHPKN